VDIMDLVNGPLKLVPEVFGIGGSICECVMEMVVDHHFIDAEMRVAMLQ